MKIFHLLKVIFLMVPLIVFAGSKLEYIYLELDYTQPSVKINSNIVHADKISGQEKKGHEKFQQERKEMQTNGYAYSTMEDPEGIFSIQYTQWNEFPVRKQKASDIILAFPYSGIDFVKPENNMGYYETYIYRHGWLGIGQYFKEDDLGICNYERLNLRLATASVRLVHEDLSYEVNNKPTHYIVKGSDSTGFSAYVDWYDETYMHQLHCGNEKFNPNFMNNVIDLAIRIDHIRY